MAKDDAELAQLWVSAPALTYEGFAIRPEWVVEGRDLEVAIETYPADAAIRVRLSSGISGGNAATVELVPIARDAGPHRHNTLWKAMVPGALLKVEREVQLAVDLADGTSVQRSAGFSAHEAATLFDGTQASAAAWRMAGNGRFDFADGVLTAKPENGLGLLWCPYPTPSNYVLKVEYRLSDRKDNSGVFVRFPDPTGFGYENAAWVGVHYGLEVQIDDIARPDGRDIHRTGALYGWPAETYVRPAEKPVGEWNTMKIRVEGQRYRVSLNGVLASDSVFPEGLGTTPTQGLPSVAGQPRFIGIQAHTGEVSFRSMTLLPL